MFRKIILIYFIASLPVSLLSQLPSDTLFTDFDPATLKAVGYSAQMLPSKKYVRNIIGKKGVKKIELIDVFKDSTKDYRQAKLLHLSYGTVLAFDRLKDYGYEAVMFIGDRDYYYDTLLFVSDTLVYKEMVDDHVGLVIVYPPKDDTLVVKYGTRNTRHDFLDKFKFQPAMKDHLSWMSNPYLDYIETYTLVRKEQVYELVKAETNRDHISAYDYKRRREQFLEAGLSPFWISLFHLSIQKGL